MAHALWKGSIQLGLVNVPVALHSATNRNESKLSWLDRRDLSPVGYERINKSTGKPVAWDDIAKGYKHDGEVVVLSEEELESIDVEATQTVDIQEFVELAEIEPVFFDTPYYLLPTGGKKGSAKASKSYVLLRETLRRTGKVGIGTVVIRQRQHLAAVFVRGPALVLDVLRFTHELRDPAEVGAPKESIEASPAEVRMAEKLVEEMTGRWRPERYKDEYRDKLLEMVERKAESGEAKPVEEPKRRAARGTGKVVYLMSLLKRSLEERKGAAPAKRRARAGTSRGSRKTRSRRTDRSRRSA
jgi:DNA end-binding protein Ku